MSFFAKAALDDRRFKELRSRRNGEQGGESVEDGNRGERRINDGNLFANGGSLRFDSILRRKIREGKRNPEAGPCRTRT